MVLQFTGTPKPSGFMTPLDDGKTTVDLLCGLLTFIVWLDHGAQCYHCSFSASLLFVIVTPPPPPPFKITTILLDWSISFVLSWVVVC